VRSGLGILLLGLLAMGTGCARLFPEGAPPASIPSNARRVSFEVVARDGRCEPSVLAADREGRAILITFQVTTVGRAHFFLIPGVGIRKEVPANSSLEISWLADRSGVHEYACTTGRVIGPLTPTGKLAVK
jgi:hypothetical protein